VSPSPAITLVRPSVLVTETSALTLPIVVVAVALLFPPTGSFVLGGAVTVAVFVTVPVFDARRTAVTVNVAAAPEFSVTVVLMFPEPLALPHAFAGGAPTVLAVQVHEIVENVEAGKVSRTAAPVTRSGPPLVTTIV
jgi:hypothetical protein